MKKFLARKITVVSLLLSTLAFVGCDGGGGTTVFIEDPYYGWFDEFGYECGNLSPGCNYFYEQDGYLVKILDVEDPYWDDPWAWSDVYYSFYYDTDVYQSPSGIVYDIYDGEALNKNKEVVSGRDVITNVAAAEKKSLENAANYYAHKFGLSADAGLKVAKTLNDFAVLQNRTEQDIADFSKRLYGLNFNNLKMALEQAQAGDGALLNGAISQAAGNLNTSPAAMKKMINSFHGKLLESSGITLN